VRFVSPVCEEDERPRGEHLEGAGLLEVRVHQHLAVLPVQRGHLDGVRGLVTPVEVPPHPVHRDAVRVTQRGAV
jgi:hypothetical protein